MANENFTTYTEVDALSRIALTASRATFTDMLAGDDQIYAYKDKGAVYFDGNFVHLLTVCITSSDRGGADVGLWALTNALNDKRGLQGAGESFLSLYHCHDYEPDIMWYRLLECNGGTLYSDGFAIPSLNTVYYLKIVRDESIGTYGTLYCYIYSNAARTALVDTLSIALHTSKKDFRYIFPVMSSDETAGTTKKVSGYSEDLNISLTTSAPSVTTQATTSIDKTTATGNGNVVSLGVPTATFYGHCWSTSPNPTTANSKTEGVPAATGAYTSAITGLLANTLYYCRAYITSSIGTFYGAEVQFTTLADVPAVTTDLCTSVAGITALGNGSIDNDGGSAITQHGHCWSLTANPTITDSKTQNGVGVVGSFTSAITGLTAATLYHTRAYATNTTGTGYGADKTFTTLAIGVPIVTTEALTAIKPPTATGNGTIVDIGASEVTQHGHCWGISANPTTADYKTTKGAGSVGAFTSAITGLTIGTLYYIRAYATNSYGTGYGDNVQILGAMTPGNICIKKTWLAYIGNDAVERYVLGEVAE